MGIILKGPAIVIYVIAVSWSFVICMEIVYVRFGLLPAAVVLVFAPITMYLVPFYAALFQGDWFALVLCYGVMIAAAALYILGEWIDGRITAVKTS